MDGCAVDALLDTAVRTDVTPSGNRVSSVSFDLADATTTTIELPARPIWVLAEPESPGHWYVALIDGTAVTVGPNGTITAAAVVDGIPSLDGGQGPIGDATVRAMFDDPLPDTRVVLGTDGHASWLASLAAPTDRYGHAVLGDAIEAGAIELRDACGTERRTIRLEAPDVVEGISPMFADLDGDGVDEIVVTLANDQTGARLAAFSIDGSLLAESTAIGRANRWRNQLGVAPLGPAGELELVDVRTPHIGGTVQFFRLVGDRLERVAATDADFTTHEIGSRNLDLGLIADANADGRVDVIVLSSDRRSIAALSRTDDGVEVIDRLELTERVSTNVNVSGDGSLAVGTRANQLIVFEQP